MSNTAIDMHNLVSSDEIFNIIETSAKNLIENPELSGAIPAIMLRGAPGVGKSTIVRSVANKLGIGFIDVRLAQMERVDFAGLPSVKDGVTEWNVPAFWPRDPKSKGIILLDEITSAPSDYQVAAYSVVLDRRIPNSNYVLPNGWLIVAAGNRTCDRAVVKTMSSALANRFVHFEVEANSEDWVKWAVLNEINPAVIGFINYRPALLFKMEGQNLEQGWPSPRSWERVSNCINMFNGSTDLLRKVVYGLIGNGVGVEFMEFFKMSAEFDSILEVMTNDKAEFELPDKADRRYAVASAVVYHLWNGKNEKDTEARVNGFYKILMKMPNDFAAMMVRAAMLGNKSVTPMEAMKKIMMNKNYKAASEKFKTALNKQFGTL
jgi:hypothetical protein